MSGTAKTPSFHIHVTMVEASSKEENEDKVKLSSLHCASNSSSNSCTSNRKYSTPNLGTQVSPSVANTHCLEPLHVVLFSGITESNVQQVAKLTKLSKPFVPKTNWK